MMIEDEPVRRESMTYEEIVKDFIVEETQYLRDLNMIIKVFRAPFVELFPRSKVRVGVYDSKTLKVNLKNKMTVGKTNNVKKTKEF